MDNDHVNPLHARPLMNFLSLGPARHVTSKPDTRPSATASPALEPASGTSDSKPPIKIAGAEAKAAVKDESAIVGSPETRTLDEIEAERIRRESNVSTTSTGSTGSLSQRYLKLGSGPGADWSADV